MKRLHHAGAPYLIFAAMLALTSCSMDKLTGGSSSAGPHGAPSGCIGSTGVCDRATTYWDASKSKCMPLSTLCGEGTEFVNGRCARPDTSTGTSTGTSTKK